MAILGLFEKKIKKNHTIGHRKIIIFISVFENLMDSQKTGKNQCLIGKNS
jgi:hypothetical protein